MTQLLQYGDSSYTCTYVYLNVLDVYLQPTEIKKGFGYNIYHNQFITICKVLHYVQGV